MTPKLLLRYASIAEAITWAVLLVGMLVKYGFDGTGLIVTIGGSLHGAVFIGYLFAAMLVGVNQRFPWGAFMLVMFAAIPPFATLLFDWWVERRGLLEGDWRSSTRITFGAARDDELDGSGVEPVEPVLATATEGGADAAALAAAAAADTKTAAVILPTLPAHPADARVAERGERTPPVRWLDPVVYWCVSHPYTMVSVAVLIAALILTMALGRSA